MRKLLILTEAYPNANNMYAMNFVHSRNKIYTSLGYHVDNLSFSATANYSIDGVNVLSGDNAKSIDLSNYQAVISHAPNIKNHIRLLRQKIKDCKKLIFIFHGHEILKINKYYPTPYDWEPKISGGRMMLQNAYDSFKLKTLKHFIEKYSERISVVYVSDWLREAAHKSIGSTLNCNEVIIPNACGNLFFNNSYSPQENKTADIISIRPLNGSKYAIDLIVESAINNPNLQYSLYGRGDYFKYKSIPKNITLYDKFLSHNEIPKLLDSHKAALMPTRLDAQGVMTCEMALYGIPTYTSNLKVCRDFLSSFPNVRFIDNNNFKKSLECNDFNGIHHDIPQELKEKFTPTHLALREIDLLQH